MPASRGGGVPTVREQTMQDRLEGDEGLRILVVSDLHGDLAAAWEALEQFPSDLLLSCGDWGDPEQVSEADLAAFPARLPVYTTFGNHDPLDALARLRNRDGMPIL